MRKVIKEIAGMLVEVVTDVFVVKFRWWQVSDNRGYSFASKTTDLITVRPQSYSSGSFINLLWMTCLLNSPLNLFIYWLGDVLTVAWFDHQAVFSPVLPIRFTWFIRLEQWYFGTFTTSDSGFESYQPALWKLHSEVLTLPTSCHSKLLTLRLRKCFEVVITTVTFPATLSMFGSKFSAKRPTACDR